MDIRELIGETTIYDKKELVEYKKPKSWLKSVSAFANGDGGCLVFGIANDNRIMGLPQAEKDAEFVSDMIRTRLTPTPIIHLRFERMDDKTLMVLNVSSGQETPYYYIGDGQCQAFVRIGNESVLADRLQLKRLVMKGAGRTYDSLPSPYHFKDMAFTKLRSVHYKRLNRSFENNEFASWGIIDENGNLTNAGALIADESPVRHSRIFCTRWNGLTMTSGLGEAIDDVELDGCVIGQLQDAVAFVRKNSKKKWWKESDHREELPDYPERAVTEVIANAIIHRDYMDLGSEVHIDMYDDRLEVYSPGGMLDGSLIQDLNPLNVPSKRRNPLLADFFNRLNLMERRGSGMRKIIDSYKQYERLDGYRAPEFRSNASEFHVVLWNMNCGDDVIGDISTSGGLIVEAISSDGEMFVKEIVKTPSRFVKAFERAQRLIYKYISQNPNISAAQMAEKMNLSSRQVQKYLSRMIEMKLIEREGGRKTGSWHIIDEDYEGFFDRI